MRLAAARAGLWFFGTIIFVFMFSGDNFDGKSDGEIIGSLVFLATVVAGVVFFYTWYDHEQKERELRNAERKKALKSSDDTSKTP